MPEEMTAAILKYYGFTPKAFLPSQKGYRNLSTPVILQDGHAVNIILYKDEPGIEAVIRRADTISNYLAARGFPARSSYDKRLLKLANSRTVRYAGIYTYLPGTTIPWEAYTMDHIKALGQAMSDMHDLLADCQPPVRLTSAAGRCEGLLDRLASYFEQTGVTQAMAKKLGLRLDVSKLNHFHQTMRILTNLPGQQALHLDFVRGNILFSEDGHAKVTGILDFEKTAWGAPIIDIARTLAFLLVDCRYKPPDKTTKYFLVSGYNKRGKSHFHDLSFGGESILDQLVSFFLVYDFYKFLKHNPYEYLDQNEHYQRTRDQLLQRGIVESITIASHQQQMVK